MGPGWVIALAVTIADAASPDTIAIRAGVIGFKSFCSFRRYTIRFGCCQPQSPGNAPKFAYPCRKCLTPVITIATPSASAAATTSASLTDPPG